MTATHPIDRSLLYIVLGLFVAGLLILTSASLTLSYKNFGSIGGYALRQLLSGGALGLVAMAVTSRVPYRVWRKWALPLLLCSFVLLALLFVPQLGFSSGGATRWLHLGPISFQPSELLKLAFIIYLASWLDARRREAASVSYGMIPFIIMLSVVGVFLIMQPDMGTLVVIVATAVLLYFLGGGKKSQVVTLVFLGIAMFYLLIQVAPYRFDRVRVFFNPDFDPQGAGYQITQAGIAIGSGGFFGLGFGKGLQKYQYLPEPMGDSIFAIFAEETGFLGAAALVGLFFFLFARGLVVARNAPDVFGKLLAAGITVGIMTQAFVNMAAISGLLPLTGIPLPFVSYGSSSLAVMLASAGILMNISRHT
ncbi:MAG: cell division protein FtsW [Parcubacteria group bacterium Greene0714_36]|nr:MAG: cell division protein FtsW [Parcubacteria group bacterium Greene0714_36]